MSKTETKIRELELIGKLSQDGQFVEDAERLAALTDKLKRLHDKYDDEIKDIRERMAPKMESVLDTENGEKSIKLDDHRYTLVEYKPRKTLNIERLLKHVTIKQLEKCYDTGTTPEPTVQITRILSEDEKDAREEKKQIGEVTRILKKGR